MATRFFAIILLALASGLLSAKATELPPQVTPLLEKCLANPDSMPVGAIDALQELVDRNDPVIRDLFAREVIRVGGGGNQGSTFKTLVYDAVDRRQFTLAEQLAAQVAEDMGDGVEMVIRTGSSGSRHMQLNNQAGGAVRYDTLISDDDISFLGPQAEEAAKRFNELKQARGLKNARVKAFSLSSITDPTSYDLLVQQIRDPDAFVGAAGFGKIRQEIVEKGGAVILKRQGRNVVAVAQTVQDFVSRNAGSTLAEIMDVAAIAADLKKFGPLTMYASAIRQMGHAGTTEREQLKYLLRIYASMEAAGSFADAASFGARKASYFSAMGEQMMTAYRDKTGKMAQALLRRHDIMQIQLDAFEAVMLSTTRKVQSMIAQAEREAGRGAVNIARHPELRRMIHELAAGFALLNQTGHSRVIQEVIPGILKSLGGSGGREASLLYKVLYTAAFDAATLTAEAAEQGVTRGVSTWTRARSPAGLIEGMAEAGQNGRQARLLLAEVGSERLPGKAADGARELQRIINESNGDTFLWKMLSNQTAQKFLIEGVALAPFAAWTMYQEWSRGEMKDLHDAAFILIDFIPGGMTTKKLGTEGMTPGTVLMFAKEALYFTPAWPFVLAGDVLYLSWTVGGAIQLQAESEGLVDVLTYNGVFDDESGRPALKHLALPGGTIVDRKEIEPWLFATKAVRVKHTLSGLEYYINNLSQKANNVLDNQFMANDPGIQQMRLAVQQHLDAINWDEAAQYFQQANVGMAMGAYLNYLAGFEFVVNADKGRPWARLYENLKKKMEERRDVVAKEHMVPQLIQLAEQKRATLDAAKTLAEDLGKLQKIFQRMRGSDLEVDLVKKVTEGADAASAKLRNATGEERQLAAGKYWQDALASYQRILEISETIVPAIVDRTGYTQAKPLGFVWTGDPAEDLRKAEQSKAGFASGLARVTRDVQEIKGSEPKVDDSVDRQALGLLAEVVFPWRHALDSQDKAEPTGASFDKEYGAAQDKVRALYAASGDLQARVDRGTRIEAGQNVMPMDKAVTFKLVVGDAELRRALADGSLSLKWSTEPSCTLRPRDDQEQVSITCFQPETVTVILTFEQRGTRAAKATSRLTLPVSIPDNMLQLNLSPATVKAGGSLTASAELDTRLLGNHFHYRWSCSNCQVGAADRASVDITAPGSEGSSTVMVEVLIEDRAGRTRSLASKSASFNVTAEDKKDDGKGGKNGKDDGKTDPYKPSCSYEYTAWGECVRATKTQTRNVTAKTPADCVERSPPKLEQSCTPPPTEEDKRHQYFNCLCRCYSGWAGHIGVWYDPEGKSVPECKSSGPCFGGAGAFGCTRRHFFGAPNDCSKSCWEGVYGKDGGYDPNKANKLRLEENKKHKQPLTVQIKASKNPADFGDIVDLTAEAAEGSGGYQYQWGGCAQDAKEASAKVTNTRQCQACTATVTVTDQDGDSASDSLRIDCTALTVKLSKERPAEDAIPIGGKAELFAEVFSGKNPANGSFIYYWEPNPDVQYGTDPKNPAYETSGGSQSRNTAVFRKLGSTPVWVTVLKQVGETKMTMGESEQILIDVVSPKLTLKADKPNPVVGETVTITVEEQPKMGDDLLGFWWEYKGDVNNPGPVPNVANQRAWSYKPKNDRPVTVTVHAKSKDNGDELDSASIAITAQKADVSVTGPRIAGPEPMIWKEGVGLVPAGRQVAEHQRVEFTATVSPDAGNLRYQWSVDPSGCTLHSPSSKETGVTCSSTGSYTLTVMVKNADGAELGTGTGGLSVTISQAQIKQGQQKAEATKQLNNAKQLWNQGRHDEAVAAAEAAAQIDKNQAAPVLGQFSQGLKQQGWDALHKGERDTAIKKLEQAVRLNPNDADAKKKLADARDHVAKWPQVEAKVREFDDHVANKRIWSAQKTMLAMQDILRTMAAGQSSNNPTWKRVMDDFNAGLQDYNRFSQEKSARHTETFKSEDYPAMLANAESMRERELSPADEKECQSRIDFAKRYLQAADLGRQSEALTRQGRFEEALAVLEEGRKIDYKQTAGAAKALSDATKQLGKDALERRDFAAAGKHYAIALKVNPQDGEAIGGDVNAKAFQKYADQLRTWQSEIDANMDNGDWDKSEFRLQDYDRVEAMLPGARYPKSLDMHRRQQEGYAAYKTWVEPLKQKVGRYMQHSCLEKARAGIMEMRARHLIWMDQDWTRVFLEAIDEGLRTCSMGNVPLKNDCGRRCDIEAETGSGPGGLDGAGNDSGVISTGQASLSLTQDRYVQGDPIQVRFTAPATWPRDAWVGIIPSSIPHGDERTNDNHDIAYQYLEKRTSGTLTFSAPAPGNWDFRLHDTDAGGKEFASVSLQTVAKGETISNQPPPQPPVTSANVRMVLEDDLGPYTWIEKSEVKTAKVKSGRAAFLSTGNNHFTHRLGLVGNYPGMYRTLDFWVWFDKPGADIQISVQVDGTWGKRWGFEAGPKYDGYGWAMEGTTVNQPVGQWVNLRLDLIDQLKIHAGQAITGLAFSSDHGDVYYDAVQLLPSGSPLALPAVHPDGKRVLEDDAGPYKWVEATQVQKELVATGQAAFRSTGNNHFTADLGLVGDYPNQFRTLSFWVFLIGPEADIQLQVQVDGTWGKRWGYEAGPKYNGYGWTMEGTTANLRHGVWQELKIDLIRDLKINPGQRITGLGFSSDHGDVYYDAVYLQPNPNPAQRPTTTPTGKRVLEDDLGPYTWVETTQVQKEVVAHGQAAFRSTGNNHFTGNLGRVGDYPELFRTLSFWAYFMGPEADIQLQVQVDGTWGKRWGYEAGPKYNGYGWAMEGTTANLRPGVWQELKIDLIRDLKINPGQRITGLGFSSDHGDVYYDAVYLQPHPNPARKPSFQATGKQVLEDDLGPYNWVERTELQDYLVFRGSKAFRATGNNHFTSNLGIAGSSPGQFQSVGFWAFFMGPEADIQLQVQVNGSWGKRWGFEAGPKYNGYGWAMEGTTANLPNGRWTWIQVDLLTQLKLKAGDKITGLAFSSDHGDVIYDSVWLLPSGAKPAIGAPGEAGSIDTVTQPPPPIYTPPTGRDYTTAQPGDSTGPASGSPRLSTDKTGYAPGDAIRLSYAGIANPAQQDWIAIYAVGAKGESYGEWHYLRGQANGELTFKAPAQAGNYEFRLMLNWPSGGFKDVARSQTISIIKAGTGPVTSPIDAGINPGGLGSIAGLWSVNANNYGGQLWLDDGGSWINLHNRQEKLDAVGFDGRTLTFTRPISGATQRYTGTRSGNRIDGTFTQQGTSQTYKWFATLVESTSVPTRPPISSGSGQLRGMQAEWVGLSDDKVGTWGSGQPNGTPDARLRLTLDLDGRLALNSISVWSANEAGVKSGGHIWHTKNTSNWMLGVFRDGRQLNGSHTSSLGEFVGRTTLDLYANQSGWFETSRHVLVEVETSDNRTLKQVVQIGSTGPGGSVGSDATVSGRLGGIAGLWSINANNFGGRLWLNDTGSWVNYQAHNRQENLEAVNFDGRTLTFTRPISGATQRYTGTLVADNRIEGTFTQQGTSTVYTWFATLAERASPSPVIGGRDYTSPEIPAGGPSIGKGELIFEIGNIGGVQNNPTGGPSQFTLNQPHVITLIQTYHWNYGRGAPPGRITIKDSQNNTAGDWQASGHPGQGGVANAYWRVQPNITLPAGTYTVTDTDPGTWARNSGSGERGFFRIEGYPAGAGGLAKPPALAGWTGHLTGISFNPQGGPNNAGYLKASAPSDGKTGYFVAPRDWLGDWRDKRAIQLFLRSQSGQYIDPYSYGGRGDIYLANGSKSASQVLPGKVGADWQRFDIPLGGAGWRLGGGAKSLEEVLANVTELQIRAEYILGAAEAGLAAPVLLPASPLASSSSPAAAAPAYSPGQYPAAAVASRLILEIGNNAQVANKPDKASKFELDEPHVITLIQTYHWNQGRGATPGTLSLSCRNKQTYGPWQATGNPSPDGVANAYWVVRPQIQLPATTCAIVDSDKGTWSRNAESGQRGFVRVEGYPAGSTKSLPGQPGSPDKPSTGEGMLDKVDSGLQKVDDTLNKINRLLDIFK